MNRTSPSEETTDFLFFLSFFFERECLDVEYFCLSRIVNGFPEKIIQIKSFVQRPLVFFSFRSVWPCIKTNKKSTYSWIKEWARVLHGNIDCVVSDALRWRRRLENKIYRRMDGHFDFRCRLEMKRKRLAILMNIQCAFVFVLASRKISFGKPLHERPAAWILDVSD